MQTTTHLHELLRGFRDETGAQICSVSSPDFGTRVEVGRPTTLSADELAAGATAPSHSGDAPTIRSRRLSATVAGYSVAAEFESEDEAEQAQQKFEELVRKIKSTVQNPF